MFYTYAHTKPDGSVFYIGKGCGKRAWAKTNRNNFWKNIVAKYKTYNVEILTWWVSEKEALAHEILMISSCQNMGHNLANMTQGGEGTSGYKHSKDWKQNASFQKKGEKNPCFGIPKSKSIKQKISQTKLSQNLRGQNCANFKGIVVATNILTGVETKFAGAKELEAANFQTSNVSRCLLGTRKTHKNHVFKRLEK